MRRIHLDFTEDEEDFDRPSVAIDPDGDGYAQNGPGMCIQTDNIEIALTWGQAEQLYRALERFFTPDEIDNT